MSRVTGLSSRSSCIIRSRCTVNVRSPLSEQLGIE